MLKRANYAWTPEDEVKLRELAGQGIQIRSISVRLRRSVSSIKKRAGSIGVELPKPRRSRFRFE
jgi:hypothetical protein